MHLSCTLLYFLTFLFFPPPSLTNGIPDLCIFLQPPPCSHGVSMIFFHESELFSQLLFFSSSNFMNFSLNTVIILNYSYFHYQTLSIIFRPDYFKDLAHVFCLFGFSHAPLLSSLPSPLSNCLTIRRVLANQLGEEFTLNCPPPPLKPSLFCFPSSQFRSFHLMLTMSSTYLTIIV